MKKNTKTILAKYYMMKNLIRSYLIVILIILSSNIYSQNETYIPLINPENTWSILADYTAGGGNHQSFYIKTSNTTVFINGKEYYEVYQTNDSIGLEDTWNHIGFLYEDIQTKKCYFMNLNSDEGLLYDFSAGVGDTVNMWNTMHQNIPVDIVVLEKDSVLIGDLYRERLNMQILPYRITEHWIEGIGSTEGLLFSGYMLIGVNYSLLCFFENDELVYHNDEHETCYYGLNTGMDNGIEIFNDIQVWPNPATINQPLQIEIPCVDQSEQAYLYMFDQFGICVYSCRLTETNGSYSLRYKFRGLFLVQIMTKNKIYQTKLLVQ